MSEDSDVDVSYSPLHEDEQQLSPPSSQRYLSTVTSTSIEEPNNNDYDEDAKSGPSSAHNSQNDAHFVVNNTILSTIFLYNIPCSSSRTALLDQLSPYGKILSLTPFLAPAESDLTSSAFVEYESNIAAANALHFLNNRSTDTPADHESKVSEGSCQISQSASANIKAMYAQPIPAAIWRSRDLNAISPRCLQVHNMQEHVTKGKVLHMLTPFDPHAQVIMDTEENCAYIQVNSSLNACAVYHQLLGSAHLSQTVASLRINYLSHIPDVKIAKKDNSSNYQQRDRSNAHKMKTEFNSNNKDKHREPQPNMRNRRDSMNNDRTPPAPSISKRLFIRQTGKCVLEKDLRRVFSELGEVVYVKEFLRKGEEGISHAFIQMATESQAQLAVEKLNGKVGVFSANNDEPKPLIVRFAEDSVPVPLDKPKSFSRENSTNSQTFDRKKLMGRSFEEFQRAPTAGFPNERRGDPKSYPENQFQDDRRKRRRDSKEDIYAAQSNNRDNRDSRGYEDSMKQRHSSASARTDVDDRPTRRYDRYSPPRQSNRDPIGYSSNRSDSGRYDRR